jgi:G3E family GTPase
MRGIRSAVDEHSPIPLTIISGPAGAGKATLIRHLLKYQRGRLAAVLRDDRAIDPASVSSRDGSVYSLTGGNIAVVAETECASTLALLPRFVERPQHVLLEGSAHDDPRRLRGYGYMPGFRPDVAIVVLEAGAVAEHANALDDSLRTEVRGADFILLNKIDLAGERAAERAQAHLESIAPAARVIWCERGQIAPPLLLGLLDGPSGLDSHTTVAEWTQSYAPIRARAGRNPLAGRQHAERCRSWCLVTEAPIEGRVFREWAQHLSPAILRGDGSVHLREEPQHRYSFHMFGAHWRLERGSLWGPDRPLTRLLFAGLSADAKPGVRRVASTATASPASLEFVTETAS